MYGRELPIIYTGSQGLLCLVLNDKFSINNKTEKRLYFIADSPLLIKYFPSVERLNLFKKEAKNKK